MRAVQLMIGHFRRVSGPGNTLSSIPKHFDLSVAMKEQTKFLQMLQALLHNLYVHIHTLSHPLLAYRPVRNWRNGGRLGMPPLLMAQGKQTSR
jgi:hypothetical protein